MKSLQIKTINLNKMYKKPLTNKYIIIIIIIMKIDVHKNTYIIKNNYRY